MFNQMVVGGSGGAGNDAENLDYCFTIAVAFLLLYEGLSAITGVRAWGIKRKDLMLGLEKTSEGRVVLSQEGAEAKEAPPAGREQNHANRGTKNGAVDRSTQAIRLARRERVYELLTQQYYLMLVAFAVIGVSLYLWAFQEDKALNEYGATDYAIEYMLDFELLVNMTISYYAKKCVTAVATTDLLLRAFVDASLSSVGGENDTESRRQLEEFATLFLLERDERSPDGNGKVGIQDGGGAKG
mmetsp:Transcript_25602/g.64505  ORF Transcript_25602/g.64505 Transcript_25602/m.64505 type:complete len:242 (+) Transcript_25602:798-1523(+)|eukprot:g17952.t1